MAKIEKIGNIQIVDNKEDKFFYFPMISKDCTGSGYEDKSYVLNHQLLSFLFYLNFPRIFPTRAKNIVVSHCFLWLNIVNTLPLKRNKAY